MATILDKYRDPRYKGLDDYVWACYSQTDSQ